MMPFNIPILLTWCRILVIPLLVGVFSIPRTTLTIETINLIATVLFCAAAITDWLDGYLARRLGQASSFGAFLDPVADKLIVAVALILLVDLDRVSALGAMIIIGREITISALREWMAQIGKSSSVTVSMLGKVKTAAQMVAIPLLLFHGQLFGYEVAPIGQWLMHLAVVLTLWSMGYYIHRAWLQLRIE